MSRTAPDWIQNASSVERLPFRACLVFLLTTAGVSACRPELDGGGASSGAGGAGAAGVPVSGSGGGASVQGGTSGVVGVSGAAGGAIGTGRYPFPQNSFSVRCTYPMNRNPEHALAAYQRWKQLLPGISWRGARITT